MVLPRKVQFVAAVVVLVGGLALAPPARAQSLGDIFDAVQTAINRATAARDRATEARDHASEIRDTIDEAVSTISTQVRDVILESVNDVSLLVDEELAGRDAFVNGPECPAFRQDLIALVQGLEDLLGELAVIGNPLAPTAISLQDEVALIGSLECRVLYPLYRVLSVTDLLSPELLGQIGDGVAALQTLRDFVTYEDRYVAGAPLDYELSQLPNRLILRDPVAARDAVLATQGLGLMFKLVGGRLVAKGHTGLQGVKVQIHGYLGVSLASDRKMKWGKALESVSQQLDRVANVATDKIQHAMIMGVFLELRTNQQTIITNQSTILANQQAILQQLSQPGP